MNTEQAENSVTLSALVVTGMYAYRKAVEPVPNFKRLTEEGKGGVRAQNIIKDYQAIFGAAPPVEWSQFLKAAGALYITLAIVAQASPDIGGAAAILIAGSAVIGGGVAVMNDLHGKGSKVELELGTKATENRFRELEKTFGKHTAEELMRSGG